MRKIFIFFSFKKKRDGPSQGVTQGRVFSTTLDGKRVEEVGKTLLLDQVLRQQAAKSADLL